MTGGAIRLHQLAKSFDGYPAVTGIDLDIPAGQFYSLLGPSGCGKTTTLRMIAGFEKPDSGRIELDGRDVVADPPHRRPVNTVFQTYALFPFMSVWDNVAFGLKYQKASREETTRRVGEALELVRMDTYAKRKPAQLSGGQQQRVALARALVLRPRVLLLDEPLGALDAALRKQLQLELRGMQREIGITFVYVTHDQEEALTMSDQIAVLAEGRVEQVGPPQEIYAARRRRSWPVSSELPTSSTPTSSRPTRGRRPAQLWALGWSPPLATGRPPRHPGRPRSSSGPNASACTPRTNPCRPAAT